MTDRPRVVVTRRLPDRTEAALRDRYDVRLNPDDRPWSAEDFADAWTIADAVVCTVSDRIPPATVPAIGARVRVVANYGVGVNHLPLDQLARAGIVVTNTPGVLTDDTADLTMALMLAVLRRLGEGEREVRAGLWTGWRPTHLRGRRLTGRSLGIIGYGRIGQAVAQRAIHGFGMDVQWFAPREPRANGPLLGRRAASLEALLSSSDIVSLHCPASPETRHLIDATRLAQMRTGAVLINTARGDVVDERALIDALQSGQLGGAGFDVYEAEPLVPAALLALPHVVVLPHMGSATDESRDAMGDRVLANLAAFFSGAEVPDRVG